MPTPEEVPTFKTATGEVVDSGGRFRVVGSSEWGSPFGPQGWLAPVRKPLLSVGEVVGKGSMIVLD
eukprot:4200074-Lingulodinium_polyedra.AAC.1